MATSEAKEIKKQETLVRFSIISYKTRLRVTDLTLQFRNQMLKHFSFKTYRLVRKGNHFTFEKFCRSGNS